MKKEKNEMKVALVLNVNQIFKRKSYCEELEFHCKESESLIFNREDENSPKFGIDKI